MEAGKLNRRILVEKRADGQDETGQVLDCWERVGWFWAWVMTKSGISASRSLVGDDDGVSRSIVRYSFRIRFNKRIAPSMRVVYQDVVFDIKQVRHDLAGKEWTDLVCEEGGNVG